MAQRPDTNELGDFLRAARGRVQPEQVGLPAARASRRLPGLRREEVALLAGVGVSYYTRIEQGQSRNIGADVLGALADVLLLTPAERTHLRTLADGTSLDRSEMETPLRADPGLLQLLEVAAHVPALIIGRYTEVLAWNAGGRKLLMPDFPDVALTDGNRPYMAEAVFLDPGTRSLYANWTQNAHAVVGNLRIVSAQHPGDAKLARLIGTLAIRSTEFSALWNDHRIQPCAAMEVTLDHPELGTLIVLQQSLRSGAYPDQILVTHTAPSRTRESDALALASHLDDAATLVQDGPPIA
ncbi:helix-turn-helix transcriptional regulator [Planctomonas sp. JC2975]|uniref:MmyB family transcriptional regulator n=1 Tax=Planctomonas sp. JC2975 TaxID=2729626 RepID=UPI00197CAEEC